MGARTWSVPLIATTERPATGARVVRLARAALVDEWRTALPQRAFDAAMEWFSDVDLALLEMTAPSTRPRGRAEAIAFRFYDGVDWPLALADHWVRLGLAAGRRRFDAALARLGYAAAHGWPDTITQLGDHSPWVSDELGQPGFVDGDDVCFWIVGPHGHGGWRRTEIAALTTETRARIEVARERGGCGCPYCDRLRPPAEVARPLFASDAWFMSAVCPLPRERILVAARWTGERGDVVLVGEGTEWASVPALARGLDVECVTCTGEHVVVVLGRGARVRQVSLSDDGGHTFAPPRPCGLPRLTYPARFATSLERRAVVFAFGGRGAALHRSDDGGLVWSETRATVDGVAPRRWVDLVARKDCRVEALVVPARGRVAFAISDDDGRTFVTRGRPALVARRLLVAGDTTLAFGATKDGGAAVTRTDDGGTTWSATFAPGGGPHADAAASGLTIAWAIRDGASSLLFSLDAGATFRSGLPIVATQLAVGPDGAFLAAVRGALVRIAVDDAPPSATITAAAPDRG